MRHAVLLTTFGDYLLVDDGALVGVYRRGQRHFPTEVGARDDNSSPAARAQLLEYFAGTRRKFDLNLAPRGTDFQQAVWRELRGIGYGATSTYGEVAARLDKPSASRAIGLAVGRNPLSIIVPCHRVLGSNGQLTGYAGGVEVKRRLLDLESAPNLTVQGPRVGD